MYVAQSNACTAPNSSIPASQNEIARGIRMLGTMEAKVRAARQAFNCLLYRGDLNTNGWPLATNGGIPSSTVTGCPSPAAQPQAAASSTASGINLQGLLYWPSAVVTLPEPTSLPPNTQQTFAQPPAPSVPPLTTQAHSAAAAALAAQVPPAANPPTFPTTGNVCVDLALNYATQSQVSPQQLDDCAAKAYGQMGIKNGPLLTLAMIQWRNANYASLPKIPDQPNLAAYTPDVGKQYGMGDFDGCSFLTGLVASVGVAAAAMYVWSQAKRMGYVG